MELILEDPTMRYSGNEIFREKDFAIEQYINGEWRILVEGQGKHFFKYFPEDDQLIYYAARGNIFDYYLVNLSYHRPRPIKLGTIGNNLSSPELVDIGKHVNFLFIYATFNVYSRDGYSIHIGDTVSNVKMDRLLYLDENSMCYMLRNNVVFQLGDFRRSIMQGDSMLSDYDQDGRPLIEYGFKFIGKWRNSFVFCDKRLKTIDEDGIKVHFEGFFEDGDTPLGIDQGKILVRGKNKLKVFDLNENVFEEMDLVDDIKDKRIEFSKYENNHLLITVVERGRDRKLLYRINTFAEERRILESIPRFEGDLNIYNREHIPEIALNIALDETRRLENMRNRSRYGPIQREE